MSEAGIAMKNVTFQTQNLITNFVENSQPLQGVGKEIVLDRL